VARTIIVGCAPWPFVGPLKVIFRLSSLIRRISYLKSRCSSGGRCSRKRSYGAPAEDRVLRFPKEKRRASLHGGAGAGLHRPIISQGIEMPTKPRSAATGPEQEHR